MGDLKTSMHIAGAGIRAQSERMKVIAENIANADSVADTPDQQPYRRKTVHFQTVLDKELGVEVVRVSKVGLDSSDFKKMYSPGHPAADADGYVLQPNVNTMIESIDMKEAQRTYEANLSVIENTKLMLNKTLDLLR